MLSLGGRRTPLDGVYKINWKVAINKSRKLIGAGIILRDVMGMVQAPMCLSV